MHDPKGTEDRAYLCFNSGFNSNNQFKVGEEKTTNTVIPFDRERFRFSRITRV